MAAERADHAKGGDPDKASGAAAPAAAPAPSAAGFKAWLPLVLNIALMPVLAFLTTTYFLAPKAKVDHASSPPTEATAKTEGSSGHGAAGTTAGRNKFGVPLSGKVLVNIAGTMGTRYLLANLTLVSPQPTLRELVERSDAELRDVAAGVLATKTIADLEKPGARNLIRTELISAFNNVLGEGTVSELYLTEFAIQ